jgi:hypothetical protein
LEYCYRKADTSAACRVVMVLCLVADIGYAVTFDSLTSIAHISAIALGLLMAGIRDWRTSHTYTPVNEREEDSSSESET